MNRLEQDQLLKELLVGEDRADFREASLAFGLTALGRQRRRRQAVRLCGFIVPSLLLVAAVLIGRPFQSPASRPGSGNSTPARVTSSPEPSGVQYINDDQLLALFPNRPVALIGKPGHQRLVFFDTPEPQVVR